MILSLQEEDPALRNLRYSTVIRIQRHAANACPGMERNSATKCDVSLGAATVRTALCSAGAWAGGETKVEQAGRDTSLQEVEKDRKSAASQ